MNNLPDAIKNRVNTDIWCCPSCRGKLEYADDSLSCVQCFERYPVLHGIPDLRVERECWLDLDEDRQRAAEVEAYIQNNGLNAAIEHIFESSRGMSQNQAAYRTRQLLGSVEKCRSQCSDWLKPTVSAEGILFEIGCGAGQMIAAAASTGKDVAAIDASLEWLVIAKYLTIQHGRTPLLAAGLAESLPIHDNAVSAIISLDVIEHVADQKTYSQEIARVLKPGGIFALSTPNRYSLSPEPHVNLWGVGYLPRSLQARYVELVKKQPYAYTKLLSVGESRALFSHENSFNAEIEFPEIPSHEMKHFGRHKAWLAKIYNRLIKLPIIKPLLPFSGAYYRITGRTVKA